MICFYLPPEEINMTLNVDDTSDIKTLFCCKIGRVSVCYILQSCARQWNEGTCMIDLVCLSLEYNFYAIRP